jgi:hypothetical protein
LPIFRKLGDPEPGDPCFRLLPAGVKPAQLCADLERFNPLPPWLLGPDRLLDQLLIAATPHWPFGPSRLDIACCCTSTDDVIAGFEQCVASGLFEPAASTSSDYRLSAAGEGRRKQLERDVAELLQHLRAPDLPKAPRPFLLEPQRKAILLDGLDEAQLCKRVLIPLLRALGFRDVHYNNGPNERGKDVLGWKIDELDQPSWLAVVAKAVDISGAAGGNNSVLTISTQIDQALNEGYAAPPIGRVIHIDRCWVITSGRIVPDALEKAKGTLESRGHTRFVRWIQGSALIELIDRRLPGLWAELQNPEPPDSAS